MVLVENYFMKDPVTSCKVRFHLSGPGASAADGNAGRLVSCFFYFPFLKRCTAHVRVAVSSGGDHEKKIFWAADT